MAIDLPIYVRSGTTVRFRERDDEVMDSAVLDAPAATGIEVMAGKVVKYLLTARGSDPLDPDYGGTAMSGGQISVAHLPKFYLDVTSDLERCRAYITRTERSFPAATEKLSALVLKDIVYDRTNAPNRVDVVIQVVTTAKHSALLSIPVTTS